MESLLNSLPQILFAGSVLYFYLLTLLLFTIFFIADYHESGFHATAAFILFIVATSIWGTFEPLEYFTWGKFGIYIGIGFLYSLIRTYFYGKAPLKYNGYQSNVKEDELKENIKSQIENRRTHLKGNVFRWWFLFPISFIDWVLTDLIKDVFNAVYKKLHKLYESILNYGLNSAEQE